MVFPDREQKGLRLALSLLIRISYQLFLYQPGIREDLMHPRFFRHRSIANIFSKPWWIIPIAVWRIDMHDHRLCMNNSRSPHIEVVRFYAQLCIPWIFLFSFPAVFFKHIIVLISGYRGAVNSFYFEAKSEATASRYICSPSPGTLDISWMQKEEAGLQTLSNLFLL